MSGWGQGTGTPAGHTRPTITVTFKAALEAAGIDPTGPGLSARMAERAQRLRDLEALADAVGDVIRRGTTADLERMVAAYAIVRLAE
jgi:hypothetical protein